MLIWTCSEGQGQTIEILHIFHAILQITFFHGNSSTFHSLTTAPNQYNYISVTLINKSVKLMFQPPDI